MSPKIVAIMNILVAIERDYPGEKAVIYSQYVSMLDLIARFLEERRIRFLRCTPPWSLSLLLLIWIWYRPRQYGCDSQRANFEGVEWGSECPCDAYIPESWWYWYVHVPNPDPDSGNGCSFNYLGLNLTACSHLILVEPPWNPALEVSIVSFTLSGKYSVLRSLILATSMRPYIPNWPNTTCVHTQVCDGGLNWGKNYQGTWCTFESLAWTLTYRIIRFRKESSSWLGRSWR